MMPFFTKTAARSFFSLFFIFIMSTASFAVHSTAKQSKAVAESWNEQTLQHISQKLASLQGNASVQKAADFHQPQLHAALQQRAGALYKLSRPGNLQDAFIYMNENGTPTFLSLPEQKGAALGKRTLTDPVEQALSFVEQRRSLFKLENPVEELTLSKTATDDQDKRHVVFEQYYKNIPVWGHELVFHFDANGLYAFNGRYSPTPVDVDLQITFGKELAIQTAQKFLSTKTTIYSLDDHTKEILGYAGAVATRCIRIDQKTAKARLVWHVQIRPNFRDNWVVFVDAANGEIIEAYNSTNFEGPATANAVDLNGVNRTINVYEKDGAYYMLDATRPIWQANQPDVLNDPKGGLWTIDVRGKDLDNQSELFHVASSNNTWNDPTSVSAHYNMGVVFDYYFNKHSRQSIDGKGSTIISVIHVASDGQPMDNAYWNGAAMAYGDGDQAFEPLAGGLDVAAHEMTHGVIQETVGLEYKFQSGALNESFADVFGAMVDDDDWTIGEDIIKGGAFPSGAMRNMADPHNGGAGIDDPGWQPAHMNEFLELDISQDNGGVHINSGIPNRACFLIADAIGRAATEKIYYRILNAHYLNKQSRFIDLRLAAIRAATDLYGENSTQVQAVENAFDAVGIVGDTGTQPPDDLPAVDGEEFVLAIGDDENLYIAKPVVQSNNDIAVLSNMSIYSNTNNPVTVSDDGSIILFIDTQNNLYQITDEGDVLIDDTGLWKSIDITPDGTKLAATSLSEDKSIYIFDLVDGGVQTYTLYRPTTQEGVYEDIVVYADALDWDLSGQYLLYDALNRFSLASGAKIEQWDLNILDVENELILPIFPPQPEGVSIGNPSFAQTNDAVFVFDYFDENEGFDWVLALDLFSGEVSQTAIVQNSAPDGFNPARPRYSTKDDRIVFQRIDGGANLIMQQRVSADRLSPVGQTEPYLTGGSNPLWFAIGQRPATLVQKKETKPTNFVLQQNFPNPFNPRTTIQYSLPQASHVRLTVFDIRGREIARLADGPQKAGAHSLSFDAAHLAGGVYLYRLEADGLSKTRKMLLVK